MKKYLLSALLLFSLFSGIGQVSIPYSADFNLGIPSGWTQQTTTASAGVFWTAGSNNFGTGGSGSAVTFYNGSASVQYETGWLQTPFLNLTSVSNPVLSLKVGIIRNGSTFTQTPTVSLNYHTFGSSQWIPMKVFGNPYYTSVAFTDTIAMSADFSSPLDSASITWVPVTISLNTLSSQNNIRFSFGAQLNYGDGWIVLEDVEFKSGVTNIDENLNENVISLFPNPVVNTIHFTSPQIIDSYFITNTLGQVVMEGFPVDKSIDVSSLEKGMYFLSYSSDAKFFPGSLFIKQ